MARHWILLLAMVPFSGSPIGAQVTTNAQRITVQLSSAQPWTDTGLDLQSGDVLEISATPSPVPASSSALPACDAKGVTGNAVRAADLPLPGAPAGRVDRPSACTRSGSRSGRGGQRTSHRGTFASDAGNEYVRNSALPGRARRQGARGSGRIQRWWHG